MKQSGQSPFYAFERRKLAGADKKSTKWALQCRFYDVPGLSLSGRIDENAPAHFIQELIMGRATRTFKLRLSPAGLDVLIASHCLLIKETRALISWGTTLHVAVEHLDGCPIDLVADCLGRVESEVLAGDEEHHLGAPHRLGDRASHILSKYRAAYPQTCAPTLGNLYIAALVQLESATTPKVFTAYRRVQHAMAQKGL
ncbi:hypothetical protein [Novosphingobium sp. KA1]|uniref:hypothetical protein n=1 Tax=Novosphingobium sp. (strain KA1) TaxID=164608 RepID=UPI001A90A714|nr:hypothetical protein [Novosphingobium sp. KA1]